jgi:signal transduction histidine kinase
VSLETWRIIEISRNKLKAAFDAIGDPIFSLTPQLKVESLNLALANLARCHPREIVNLAGERVMGMAGYPGAVSAEITKAAAQVLALGEGQCHLMQTRDEQPARYFEVTLTPVRGGAGEVHLVIVQVRDVTLFKRMEETIREYNRSLEDKVAERTRELVSAQAALQEERDRLVVANAELLRLDILRQDLTNMVVHDLKGPLAEVMGNLDLLSYEPLSETQSEARELAALGGEDLLRMIMNLLDISRLEEDALTLRKGMVSFSEQAETLAAKFQTMIRLKGMQVTTTDRTKDRFLADPELLQRVLQNLFTNALGHTPEGGAIDLQAEEDGQGGGVVLTVRDNGEGIPLRHQGRIFQKFTQADDSGGPRTSTGLGLTFCKMAVEAHGGRIWFTSQEGAGAAFFVWLPR